MDQKRLQKSFFKQTGDILIGIIFTASETEATSINTYAVINSLFFVKINI